MLDIIGFIVAFLLLLFAPFLFGYGVYNFVSWFEYPNPASWSGDSRMLIGMAFVIWSIVAAGLTFGP